MKTYRIFKFDNGDYLQDIQPMGPADDCFMVIATDKPFQAKTFSSNVREGSLQYLSGKFVYLKVEVDE